MPALLRENTVSRGHSWLTIKKITPIVTEHDQFTIVIKQKKDKLDAVEIEGGYVGA